MLFGLSKNSVSLVSDPQKNELLLKDHTHSSIFLKSLSNITIMLKFSGLLNSHALSVQKFEVADFSGLRSSGCVTFSNRESSFFDVVSAQLTPKVTL